MATQTTSSSGTGRLPTGSVVAFALIGFAFVVVNFATTPVVDAIIFSSPILSYVFAFLLGSLAGQWGTLAVWMALGSQGLAVRLTLAPLSGSILFASLVGGMVASGGTNGFKVLLAGLVLPLLLAAIAIPLAVARVALAWRIARSTAETSAPKAERQFTIPQVLGLTAALAVALGLARRGLAEELARHGAATIYTSMGVIGLVVVAWSAFIVMPAVWSALASQRVSNGLVGLIIYAAGVSLLPAVVLNVLNNGGTSLGEVYSGVLCLNAGLLVPLLTVLLTARSRGYMLVRS